MASTTVYLLDYHALSLVSFAAVVWSYHAARSLTKNKIGKMIMRAVTDSDVSMQF